MESNSLVEIDGFTVPGFLYLGPGNPINNGSPVNRVDLLAKEHDIRYEEVQQNFELHQNKYMAFEDIQNADRIFVEKLKDLKTQSWCEAWGKLLGCTIINVKTSIEKCLGFTLYPRFVNRSTEC